MPEVPADVADRLYEAPPEGFVARREEAIAAARDAGDNALAKEIGKLRKPTIAAWLVNLLALRRPELVAELADLSAALRKAQRELRGDDLRELSVRRRTVVSRLVAAARGLAAEADPGVDAGRLPLTEVESTLNAALADAEVAEIVRTGRLVRSVVYAGFGEVPRPQLRLLTGGRAAPTKGAPAAPGKPTLVETPPPGEPEPEPTIDRAAVRREMAAARTVLKRADADLERAAAAEADGARALAELDAEIAELQRRRVVADEELGRRKLARKTAERAVSAARRRLGEAEGAMEQLDTPPIRGRADRAQARRAQSGG